MTTAPSTTATVVYHPASGGGGGAGIAEWARQCLTEQGWDAASFPTRPSGEDVQRARARIARTNRLVVVGGDGTLREVAESLGEHVHRVELALVPMGNANVLARELGIPLDPRTAARVAASGQPRSLDVLRANGRLALAMVSVGFDATVADRVDHARQGGFFGAWYRRNADSLYAAVGLVTLFSRMPRCTLEVDGKALPGPYSHLVISNTETFGKGWAMTPGADPTDGKLDYQARRRSAAPYTLCAMGAASRRARVSSFISDYGSGVRCRVVSEHPFRWQADGDPMGRVTELEVELLPAALTLIAPAKK